MKTEFKSIDSKKHWNWNSNKISVKSILKLEVMFICVNSRNKTQELKYLIIYDYFEIRFEIILETPK